MTRLLAAFRHLQQPQLDPRLPLRHTRTPLLELAQAAAALSYPVRVNFADRMSSATPELSPIPGMDAEALRLSTKMTLQPQLSRSWCAGASASHSPTLERSAIAGPSRHYNAPPSAAHIHRHRSAKVPFSYRTHFKMAYLTESNWRKGGRLQTQHVSADAGHVVTSLAIDSEWIVVGMANSKIHVFSAQTGLYAHTLLGHDAGVWCLTLISRTTGKGKKISNGQAEASDSGKGKMVIPT